MKTIAAPLVAHRPTAVYRFFDAEDRLLYVGITCNLGSRFQDHERRAQWWLDQRSVQVVWRDTRAEAAEEERIAILGEKPLYNIWGTRPPRERVRAERLDVATRQAIAAEVRAEVARAGKSKREVRELLGVSRQAAWQRMTGETPFQPDELIELAAFLGIPVDRFVPRRCDDVLAALGMFDVLVGGTA